MIDKSALATLMGGAIVMFIVWFLVSTSLVAFGLLLVWPVFIDLGLQLPGWGFLQLWILVMTVRIVLVTIRKKCL